MVSSNFKVYKALDTPCGGMNRNGPLRLIGLNAWPMGSGTTMGCGLVEGGVALMEKVCHCEAGL